jgi:hypothetical protein
MMLHLLSSVMSTLSTTIAIIFYIMICVTIFISFCSYMGWIKRLLWYFIEVKLREIFNDTEVTIGSIEINLVEGNLVATNAILHTPHQSQWNWESPLIARVGRVVLEWNMWGIAYQFFWLWIVPPKADIYTVILNDIQVFVERQYHIFNLYLVDPTIVLPNPADFVKLSCASSIDEASVISSSPKRSSTSNRDRPNDEDAPEEDPGDEQQQKQKAHELIQQFLTAVKTLGRKGAWRAQKESIRSQLRQFQSITKKAEYMQEKVKIITEMGKAVVMTSKNTIPQVPERRELDEPPFYCRVGRVVIQDARIFTRQDAEWNKPIVLREVVIRASELCPPLSSLDEEGYPAIYQRIDKVLEVVWKRVLTEMAKSQTGRFLSAAMGEVLGIALTSMESVTNNPNLHHSSINVPDSPSVKDFS